MHSNFYRHLKDLLNVEPLTAFFFLEGLTFDIIGAYIIVTGLFGFRKPIPDVDSEYYSANLEGFKETMKKVKLLRKDVENHPDTPNSRLALKEIYKLKLQMVHTSITAMDLFNLDLRITENEKQHESARNKGIRGLPLLIGGFLLQGIGVVLQLTLVPTF